MEVGARFDGGAADTGAGLEVGAGLHYAYPAWGLTVAANGRVLMTHEDREFREWGAGGSIRVAPGPAGRGPSLTLTSAWGDPASGAQQLWSQTAGVAAAIAPDPARAPAAQVEGEL